ncbi:LADA_0F03114g1_1 [Lachancea dasiensis]|uniref:LADA_0F03114g1_1 n=1 Tax=Lachancea dasiensis TaxID=1072105 RepID=A0A1G4JIP5_9SACH|nr:LADA_0F03114g1_1 [Lachancea dasiensis]
MLSSQILRSSTLSINRAVAATLPKSANRIILRASHKRIGQSWAITEAKRLAPTVGIWSAFMVTMFGWPFAIKAFQTRNNLE